MSSMGEGFVPHDFVIVPSDSKRKQCQSQAIRVCYDPLNFQHLSLIARMFNPAFINHSDRGDISGLAVVVKALPHITFMLYESSISVQFVAEPDGIDPRDPSLGCDLSAFVDAAPCGVKVAWQETLMLRRDSTCKIAERWQAHVPVIPQESTVS